MREVTYTDPEGRKWARLIPNGVPDEEAKRGVPLGPPSLAPLNLPLHIDVALHNELFNRRLLTHKAVKRQRALVVAAMQSALRLDASAIMDLFAIDDTA